MSPRSAPAETRRRDSPSNLLRGRRLHFARVAWIVVAVAVLGLDPRASLTPTRCIEGRAWARRASIREG